MDRVVVGELSEGKELIPVILKVIAKDAKEPFDLLIDSLCLAVRLRMMQCCECVLDTKHLI